MNPLVESVRARCDEAGLEPSVLPDPHLLAALRRRQRVCGVSTLEEYAVRYAEDPREQAEILEELLVRESWFFRDLAPYALLTLLASTRWRDEGANLHALSAPCANGEEAYSIAIALAEGGHALSKIAVSGLDLSRRGLIAAAAGCYDARAISQLPAALRQRWLTPTASGHYAVQDSLRDRVQCRAANLLALPEELTAQRYQVVCCRNAMIYLRPAARLAVLERLVDCLTGDGVLIVGHAEAALVPPKLLRPLGPPGAFAFERAPSRPVMPARSTAPRATRAAPRPGTPPSGKRVPAPVATPPPRPDAPALLAEARALADRGLYGPAVTRLEHLLARHFDHVEALHLLGLIRAAEGATEEARRCFDRALYLDPDHQASLEHLALLAVDGSDSAATRRLRRRLARQVPGA